MAFCVSCGYSLKENYSFCGKCGSPVDKEKENTDAPDKKKLTLSEFTDSRQAKRQSHFKGRNSSSSATTTTTTTLTTKRSSESLPNQQVEKYVLILVGQARRDDCGDLKPIRGKRLPLRIRELASDLELKRDAINKHADNDQEFCSLESYVLLFPDMKEVIFIPSTTKRFVLKEYKQYLGKPFSQILFYLCTLSDYKLDRVGAEQTFQEDESKLDIPTCPKLFSESLLSDNFMNDDENDLYYHDTPPIDTPVINDKQTKDRSNLKEKLSTIEASLKDAKETFALSVRRRKIWLDTSQKLKRAFKDGVRPIVVEFIGEEADDAGGPLKEFFSVLFDNVKSYLMCSGRESKFTLVHDIEKLRNGDFLLLGNLIGLSIICGCAGPRCFIPGVVSKLFTREQEVQFTILDVPDIEIQTKLEELQSTACEDSFQACLQSFPERFDAGITRHSIKFEDKSMFIQTICEHFCVSRCLEELQDLAKGIDILGLYSILAEHYDEAKTEFIICGKTKSKDVIAIFGEINYTEVVENDPLTHELRDKEEDIYYNFSNFIETLEFEDLKLPTVIQIDEDVEMNAETTISLNDVVRFCTGSKFVMPAMKKQGIIAFTHPDEFCQGKRIVAYTCTYKLVFPVTERYCGSSEDFCKNFCDDIASAPGFGIS